MPEVKEGDKVKVIYKGMLEDGSVFDKSVEDEPLKFTVGEGKIIPGFENAVMGMSPGESKVINVTSDDAYGEYRDEFVMEVERDNLPEGLDPQVGQQLQLQQEGGQPFIVTVTETDDESITIDGNHPLAGKDLTFEIELLEIE